jgi:NNP family nitrate/nitrite transporter-like MFS transporter
MLLIVVSAIYAYLFMNYLNVSQSSPKEQAPLAKRKHTWVMSYLYIGTFCSSIGYSASFPLLITNQFPEHAATWFAALGPIVGSLIRPVGGWLTDKFGGARVTFWTFGVMIGRSWLCSTFSQPGGLEASFLRSCSCSSPRASVTARPTA